MSSTFIQRYIIGSALYGGISKLIYTHNATYCEYNYKTHEFETTPMLFVDRLMCVGVGAMFGPVFAIPAFVSDCARAEVYFRGLDAKKYGLKKDDDGYRSFSHYTLSRLKCYTYFIYLYHNVFY